MSGEGVNCSGASNNFTAVMDTTSDEIFLSSRQWNALAIDNQGVAALSDDHVFVVVVNMRC
jgi:hypothetical protein